MRSVPHRVVCLLGLDDAAFPRKAPARRRRHHARRPARRRPRPAPRGPPDAARRADGRDGPADRHLRGQRRAHEHAAAARRAGRRAARHDRADGRTATRARRCSSATRSSPSTRATSRPASSAATPPWSFNRVTLDGARAMEEERDRAAAVPGEPAAAATRADPRARRPRRVRPPPRAGVPPPAAGLRRRDLRRRGRGRRSRSSSTPSSRGRSASGCSTPASRARRRTPLSRRSAPAASCRPACSPSRSSRSCMPDGRADRQARRRSAAARRRRGVGRRAGHAPRRPAAERDRARRPRHAAAQRHVLAREPAAPAGGLGAVPRAHRRAPRPRVRGGDDRPRGLRRAAGRDRDRRAAAEDRRRRSRSSTSPRSRRCSTTACASRCRSPARPRPPTRQALRDGRDAVKAAKQEWDERVGLPERGPGARAPAACSAACCPSTSWSRAAGFDGRARRLWDGLLGWEQVAYRMTDAVRRLRPAPDRRDGARGERRAPARRSRSPRWPRATSPTGVPLDQLLMVTFTRMATGELRERVRERLVSAEHGLERALAGAPPEDDEVVQLLATGSAGRGRAAPRAAGARRWPTSTPRPSPPRTASARRCSAASACSATSRPTRRSSRTSPTCARRSSTTSTCAGSRRPRDAGSSAAREALAIARGGDRQPGRADRAGRRARRTPIAAMRVRLAGAARERARRAQAAHRRDDLRRPADAPARHARRATSGEVAAARLRARYRVVLVDEFQDTDPVQWEIMRTAFGDGEATLVLIGDPKQAIYAFRGADVYAYIEAARTAGTRGDARRSTGAATRGCSTPTTRCSTARSSGTRGSSTARSARAANAGARLHGAPDPAPLRIRVVPRDERRPDAPRATRGSIRRASTSPATSPPTSSRCSRSGAEDRRTTGPIRPGHIAVLVRTNRNAARVRDALEAVDVPAVINGAGSVFGTEPAREWLRLLEAIERPSYPPARPLGGADHVPRLDDRAGRRRRRRRVGGGAPAPASLGARAAREGRRVADGGDHARGGPAGARARDGRRRAADDRPPARRRAAPRRRDDRADGRHRADRRGCASACSRRRRDNNDEERSRRLESDAEAVQVLTMHRSKGLEFPVVYYPDLWEPSPIPREKRAR